MVENNGCNLNWLPLLHFCLQIMELPTLQIKFFTILAVLRRSL